MEEDGRGRGLFGWTLTDAVPADAPGSYDAATWNTYVAVVDADTTAAAVTAAGGTVVSAPADAGPGGRTATCVDPAGADRDASAATAERLGATIVTSAEDLWTKNAVVRDPQGAEFTISQFTPPDGDW
jgi:hypothetical protein